MANQKLTLTLLKVLHLRNELSPKGAPFRTAEYMKTIKLLRSMDRDITLEDIETGAVLLGKAMRKKITEFLQTGTISVEKLKKEETRITKNVHGVGVSIIKTASEILEKNPSDITERDLLHINKKSKIRLTSGQKSMLQFSINLKREGGEGITGIKVRDFKILYIIIKTAFKKAMSQVKVKACGSYRRNKKNVDAICNDIDMIWYVEDKDDYIPTTEDIQKILGSILDVGLILSKGSERLIAIVYNIYDLSIGRRIYFKLDIFRVHDYPAGILFATGSQMFNVMTRSIAKKQGFKLNQNGLFDRKTGKQKHFNTEKQLLKFVLGVWIAPEDR
jgi:DNA polymerase (family 10)